METSWMFDRMRLYQLMQQYPDWSIARLAQALARSSSWVKKWRRRFREALKITLEPFKGHSRAPQHRPHQISAVVKRAVLSLREALGAVYNQPAGPKRILFHLKQDTNLAAAGHRLPTSATTLWRILRDAGRITQPISRITIPLPRPAPMREWEFDFGQINIATEKLEFWTVVDRGTSILVDLQGSDGYNAETALLALVQTLIVNGRPARMRFDNDPRFASWTNDGFPSALERLLLCLDIQVHRCDPASPWQKPFVERVIGTVKYEHLDKHKPETVPAGIELLLPYPAFYNHERPNQGLACGNQPPYTAFPQLPALPPVPDQVDPDHWLQHCHATVFRRTVDSQGSIQIDKDRYYIGRQYVKQRIILSVDAHEQAFRVLHSSQFIKQLPIKGLIGGSLSFSDFIQLMAKQARSMVRYRQMKRQQQRR